MVIFLILSYCNIFWDFRYEILTSQILVSCNSLVRLSCNLCIKYTPNQQPPYPNVQQIFRRMLLCSQNVRKDRLVYFHFLRRMMPLFRSCSHYLSKTDRLRYRHIGASTKGTILKDQPCKRSITQVGDKAWILLEHERFLIATDWQRSPQESCVITITFFRVTPILSLNIQRSCHLEGLTLVATMGELDFEWHISLKRICGPSLVPVMVATTIKKPLLPTILKENIW